MTVGVSIPREFADIGPAVAAHDIVFLDQFGVLHDGTAAYPGAIETLVALKSAGKRIVLLSNSGKRSSANEERLLRLGFEEGSWDLFLSSGEVAWRIFAGLGGEPALPRGTRLLYLARDDDRTAVEGLDVELVAEGREAEAVLIGGSKGEHLPFGHYEALLEAPARAGVPCICTNPDKVMLTPSGPRFGAGRIAERYEAFGGAVRWIGKPFPEIYRAALAALGDPSSARVVCIGDSIEHDIAGARAAGLAACLVRTGILADADARDLAKEFDRHRAMPDFIVPRFALDREARR